MKTFLVAALSLMVLLFIAGCGKASREEVLFAVQKLEDFKEVVQTINISGSVWGFVEVDKAEPELQKKEFSGRMYAMYIIIYKTKTGGLRIATFNWDRPPTITALSQEIKP